MARPAIVVGSGPNGLSAAITLAEAGRDVVVLEAADHVGGAVQSAELTAPGFVCDVFSAVYPAGAASPVFARWPLAEHGLEWVHPAACVANPLEDGTCPTLYRDLERTAQSLDAHRGGDGDRWLHFARPLLDAYPALRATLLSGFPPVVGPARLTAKLRLGGALEVARLLLAPATALGDELFEGEGNRAWLYGAALHGDTPPRSPGSAIAAAYLYVLGHAVGWPSPRGGAGRLADALHGYLRSLGGTVRTGTRVDAIDVDARGRVRGVRTEHGERVDADLVVCDTTPGAMLRLVGAEHFGPRYLRALRRYRPGPGTLKVDWALDGPVPWTAREARQAGTVHVGGGEDALLGALAEQEFRLPQAPFLLFGQQSVADPTRAPAGGHTAWAYAHGPRDADWVGDGQAYAERMEAQVERFAPGFRDRIKARYVMGPDELMRRNLNLDGGDVGGGSYTLDQLVFRPAPKLSPYATGVRGLWLGSASTFPGGAVHGVPGHAAAQQALFAAKLPRR